MSVQILLHANFVRDFAGGSGDIKLASDLTNGDGGDRLAIDDL